MNSNSILEQIQKNTSFDAAQFCSINFRTLAALSSYIKEFLENPDILSPKKSFVFNKAMVHLAKETQFGIARIGHIPYREWLILSNQIEEFKAIQNIDDTQISNEGFLSSVVNRAGYIGLDKTYLLSAIEDIKEYFPEKDIESFYRKFSLKMGSIELKSLGKEGAQSLLLKHWGEDINHSHSKEGTPLIFQLSQDEPDYEYINFLVDDMKASFEPSLSGADTRNPLFHIRTSSMLELALKNGVDINFQNLSTNILSSACSYYENKMHSPQGQQAFLDFISAIQQNGFNFEMMFESINQENGKPVKKLASILENRIQKSSKQCYKLIKEALPIIKQKFQLETKILSKRETLDSTKSAYKV